MRWPQGVTSAGVASGIKGGDSLDLGVLAFDQPCSWAGVFTQNAAAAAPVVWSKARAGERVRALVVNSGNANACTGERGREAVRQTAEHCAGAFGCAPGEVLVASTGPIGVHLPVDRVRAGVDEAVVALTTDAGPFSRAIMTTDTFEKTVEVPVGTGRIVGVAKGAAMLAPRMATMLAFIVTDVSTEGSMRDALRSAVDPSFNSISIDGCESTNDSVYLFSTAASGMVSDDEFGVALQRVCAELAEMMLADAEGGTKIVDVEVSGAPSAPEAARLARSVAASSLWRAATHGADPNWGRVVAALGTALGESEIANLVLSIGPEIVFAHGEPTGSLDVARKAMLEKRFKVVCDLGLGEASATLHTVDLTPEYVALNAEGST